MSSNFLRLPNNQTDFLKDPKQSAFHPKVSDRKKIGDMKYQIALYRVFLCASSALVNCK